MIKISIVIPSHNSPTTAWFLTQLFHSISVQTFKDYEIILVNEGLAGHNMNIGIKKAKGEIIKIMCQDDMFASKHSLQDIVDNFKGDWMIVGSHNNPHPLWNDQVPYGYNTLGGLSTIVMRNQDPILFDEKFKWMIDVEWYAKAYVKYGLPQILDSINVNIGLHPHQTTSLLTDEEKLLEFNEVKKRYEANPSYRG